MRGSRRSGRIAGCILFAMLMLPVLLTRVAAHDVRPAYLQIDQLSEHRYALLWRTPLLSGAPLPVALALPAEATTVSPPRLQTLPGSLVERSVIDVPGGLAGKRIDFVGLETTITDVLVRLGGPDGVAATTIVRPSRPFLDLDTTVGQAGVALAYLRHGVEHILYGIDHLLFVAALLLIVRDWRALVKTVTAFTVAHSITLALATFGLLRLPPLPVEVLIAASIALVALEAVRRERGGTSLAIRRPYVVAFVFGLLHGSGFAGALQSLGLPQGDVPLALLTFNLGVEIGQLMFLAVVLLAIAALRSICPLPRQSVLASCYVIGIVSTFWVLERLQATFA